MQLSIPPHIQRLVPYKAGKPIEETQREYGIRSVVKLASNENPLGPSPKALAAARAALSKTHRYPDSAAYHLKAALAKELTVQPENLFIGCGSDEVFEVTLRSFTQPGDVAVACDGAFAPFRIACMGHGLRMVEPPLRADLSFDLEAMARAIREEPTCKVAFIANPNNPTGAYNKTDEVRAFLKEVAGIRGGSVFVILDYAYWEYVTAKDLPDPMELWREFPNVVVTRTFSKIYGMAGFRVGYGVAAQSIIDAAYRVRLPFNVASPSLDAAVAALSDKAFVKKSRAMNSAGMKQLSRAFDAAGIKYFPSQANFILIDTMESFGKPAPEVFEACLRKGVIFRPVYVPGRPGALRFSIGTAAENKRGIQVLVELKGPVAGKKRRLEGRA